MVNRPDPRTATESARLRLPPTSAPTTSRDGPHVVVDIRTPEQLVLGLGGLPAPLPLLAPEEGLLGASWWQRWVKRSMDVLLAGLALLVLSPLLLGAALLVKLTSRGPVLYTSWRLGRDARPFRLLKLRTMYRDAEARRPEVEAQDETDGPVFKIRRDPRTTPVGRLLRRLSVDELPQLIHVLSGKMSLVGPRPPLPEEVAAYRPREAQRLLVKPGLTCIWQVSGRSDLGFDTWMQMDLEYIRRWSLRLDLRLLARTLPAVLSGHGAY